MSVQQGAAAPGMSGLRRTQLRFIVTVMVPTMAFFCVYRFFPVGYAFFISLHDKKLLRAENVYVGFENYARIAADPIFRLSIGNAFYYAVGATFFGVIVSLFLTLLLNPIRRGSLMLRLFTFCPR